MGDFNVLQRTKDGMFNATDLLKQWNRSSGQKKKLDHYFENKSTEEFIESLMDDEEFSNARNSVYLKTRGKYGGTLMHPYLFIDFAMWINPRFKVQVIKFVYDQLIRYRNNAGDNYVNLSASGVKLKGYDFAKVAVAMQYIIFGKRGKNMRQIATEAQLFELNNLQMQLAFAIDMGYIANFDALISELRRIWNIRKYKTPF